MVGQERQHGELAALEGPAFEIVENRSTLEQVSASAAFVIVAFLASAAGAAAAASSSSSSLVI